MGWWDERNQRWAAKQVAAGKNWRDRAKTEDFTFATSEHGLVRVNIEAIVESKPKLGLDHLPIPAVLVAAGAAAALVKLVVVDIRQVQRLPTRQIVIRTMSYPHETAAHAEQIPRRDTGKVRMRQIVEHLEHGGWVGNLPPRPTEPERVPTLFERAKLKFRVISTERWRRNQ